MNGSDNDVTTKDNKSIALCKTNNDRCYDCDYVTLGIIIVGLGIGIYMTKGISTKSTITNTISTTPQ